MMFISFLWLFPTIITAWKFLASDNACFNAVDRNQSTIFKAPKRGTLLGIELIYKSGSVTCGYGAYEPSHFGCAWDFKDYPLMIFLERVTDSDLYEGDKYYPTTDTDDVTDIVSLGDYWYWYHMESYTINSHIIALLNPSYTVTTSYEFMLQYGEANGASNGDNDGTACAQVYFVYKDNPICISGSGTFDAKYKMISTGNDSWIRYAASVDKYLYVSEDAPTSYSSGIYGTYPASIQEESVCVNDEDTKTSGADECCRQIGSLYLEGCEWGSSDRSSSSSTYCQDFCISDGYHSVLDGTYTWDHYNVSTHSSVYYYASYPSYLFLWWFEDEDVWNWRIGADYTAAGAWSSCHIERDTVQYNLLSTGVSSVEGAYPDTCEGWMTYYDDAWNTDDITVDACGYYVASTTTTTTTTTVEPIQRNIYGYGDDSEETDDLTSMWVGLGIFGGLLVCGVMVAMTKTSNKNEKECAQHMYRAETTAVNNTTSGGYAVSDNNTTSGGYAMKQDVAPRGTCAGSTDVNNITSSGDTLAYPQLAARKQFTTQYTNTNANNMEAPAYNPQYNNLHECVEPQMVQNEGNNTMNPCNNDYNNDAYNNEAPAEMIGNEVASAPLSDENEYNHEYNEYNNNEYNNELNDNYEAEPVNEAEPELNDNQGEDPGNNDYNDYEGDPGGNNNDYGDYGAPEAAEYNANPIEFDGGVHIVLQGHDMEPMPEYVPEPEPVPEPIPEPVAEPFMEPMTIPDPSGFAMEVAGSAVCMI